MDFDSIGTRRTALFIIVSDTDTTFNFIAAMMYSQLFNRLCDLADDKFGGRLPYHVRILADEMANIGKIPNFDKLIATIRSREISVAIILQAKSQLKTMYCDETVHWTVSHARYGEGRCPDNRGELRQLIVFGRQGRIHAEGDVGTAGKGNH